MSRSSRAPPLFLGLRRGAAVEVLGAPLFGAFSRVVAAVAVGVTANHVERPEDLDALGGGEGFPTNPAVALHDFASSGPSTSPQRRERPSQSGQGFVLYSIAVRKSFSSRTSAL